jgi:S-adenosylmethionine hydrolase
VTNFEWPAFGAMLSQDFLLQVGLRYVTRAAGNYSAIEPGELCAIEGSAGYIEISAREASAASILGVAAGAPVELRIGTSSAS